MFKYFKLGRDDEKSLIKDQDGRYGYDSDEENDGEDTFQKNDITLWMSDAVVLVVEHLQYYAVLLALSEHWGWPISWVESTCFTFAFNFDAWEFRKVVSGLFDHSRTSFIDSKALGFDYVSYLAAWAVLVFITAAVFGGVYIRLMRKRPLHLLWYIARWKRVMFMVVQFLAIPFGIVTARIFHCRKNDNMGEKVMDEKDKLVVMDVQNEFLCGEPVQLTLMVLVIIIYLLLYLFYPFILTRWVSEQVFSNDARRHEGYIQLKEAEYEQGLDIQWDIGQYHLFSSYNRPWAYYNPLKFIFKFLFVLAFAFSVRSDTTRSLFWSSAGITVLFCLATVALVIRRPFRVKCFNVMIIVSHAVLFFNSLIGNFMVRPPWEERDKFQIVGFLLQPTITYILSAINATWILTLLVWIFYLVLVNSGKITDERLWPRLSYDNTNTIGDETKRYLKAALKARRILESALAAIPLFAPIHDLSHQVQVINAYCREAEMLNDPTHDTLIDILDELIEAHNTLAPVSVFGLSGKNSIRETSEEFIKLMPSFKKRLRQREYDFILMTPLKRRLLLKMYIMSVFIGSIKKKQRQGDDVKTKLQEALALFDTRSLDNIESIPSTSTSSGARTAMSGIRGIDGIGSAMERGSSMSAYLNNVDDFLGKNMKVRGSDTSTGSGGGGEVVEYDMLTLSNSRSGKRLPLYQTSLAGLKESEETDGLSLRPGTSPSYNDGQTDEVVYRPTSAPSTSNTATQGSAHKGSPTASSSSLSIPGQVGDEEFPNVIANTNTTVV